MSISRWTSKQKVLDTYNGILYYLSLKGERILRDTMAWINLGGTVLRDKPAHAERCNLMLLTQVYWRLNTTGVGFATYHCVETFCFGDPEDSCRGLGTWMCLTPLTAHLKNGSGGTFYVTDNSPGWKEEEWGLSSLLTAGTQGLLSLNSKLPLGGAWPSTQQGTGLFQK